MLIINTASGQRPDFYDFVAGYSKDPKIVFRRTPSTWIGLKDLDLPRGFLAVNDDDGYFMVGHVHLIGGYAHSFVQLVKYNASRYTIEQTSQDPKDLKAMFDTSKIWASFWKIEELTELLAFNGKDMRDVCKKYGVVVGNTTAYESGVMNIVEEIFNDLRMGRADKVVRSTRYMMQTMRINHSDMHATIIPSVMSAEETYTSIYNFLIWCNEPVMVTVSNDQRIVKAGFDRKSSFRPKIRK